MRKKSIHMIVKWSTIFLKFYFSLSEFLIKILQQNLNNLTINKAKY